MFVPADKTTNIYKISVDEYKKLLKDNITSKYKQAPDQTMKSINAEAKSIATKLRLDERIERFPKREVFINIKDHKPNFPNNIKCRLINPAKSEIGKITKTLLDQINSAVRSKSNLNQWRNTKETIDWFTEIPQKHTCRFLKFDIHSI